MAVYMYSEARQRLAALLRKACEEGEVKIRRKDGRLFVLKPEQRKNSPLDVKGVDLDISLEEILHAIHETRRR